MKGRAFWCKGRCQSCMFAQQSRSSSRGCRAHFWENILAVLFTLLFLGICSSAHSSVHPVRINSESTGVLDKEAFTIYELTMIETCLSPTAFMNMQLVDQKRMPLPSSQLRPSVLGGAPAPGLFPNLGTVEGNLTWDHVSKLVNTNMSNVIFKSFMRQFWMHSISMENFQNGTSWYVLVVNAARQVPLTSGFSSPVSSLNYSITFWCTESPRCPLDCGGHGVCGDNGICECDPGWADDDCRVEVLAKLKDFQPLSGNVGAGEWAHYLYEGGDATTGFGGKDTPTERGNFLVELERLSGDPVLLAKPVVSGVRGDLKPYFRKTVDGYNYLNRFSFHYVLLKNISFGNVIVGVYNDKAESEMEAAFTITVRRVPVWAAETLCPRNCSWPNGVCGSDGTLAGSTCMCADGFAGSYCQGELREVVMETPLSGQLSPGAITYFRYDTRSLSGNENDLGITFSLVGGNGAVVAKHNGTPALNDNDLRFFDDSMSGNGGKLVRVGQDSLLEGVYTFAIFNSDYSGKGDLKFKLQLSAIDPIKPFILGPLLSTIVGIVSSAILFLGAFSLKRCFRNRRNESSMGLPMESLGGGTRPCNEERGGLHPNLILAFPLITVEAPLNEKDRSTSSDSHINRAQGLGQCAVCLSDYDEGEELRQLLPCRHAFHIPCINGWLSSHVTCPMCRVSLVPCNTTLSEPSGEPSSTVTLSSPRNRQQIIASSSGRGESDLEGWWSTCIETDVRNGNTVPIALHRDGASSVGPSDGLDRL